MLLAPGTLMRRLGRDPKTYDGGYQQLRNDARDAGLSYVDVNQPYPTLQGDAADSWWHVRFNLVIRTIDGPDQEGLGRVHLRVDHDGHVCRVNPAGTQRSGNGPERQIFSACVPGSRRLIKL